MTTISWIDDAGRLAEVDISDQDAAKLRAGRPVAAYSAEPRRTEPAAIDREISGLEHRQDEIRAELDDIVNRHPQAKSL